MRILYICPLFLPYRDGTTRLVYDQARKLVENGHDVVLITGLFQSSLPKHEVIDGIKVTRVRPLLLFPKRLLSLYSHALWTITLLSLCFRQFFEIRKIKSKRFDVLHAYGNISALVGIYAKMRLNVPLVLTIVEVEVLLGTLGRKKSVEPNSLSFASLIACLISRRILKFADRIICPSFLVKRVILGEIDSNISNKIDVIPIGVDSSFFTQPKHEIITPRVLFVGYLSVRKGVDILIRAASMILKKIPNAEFLIVGTPSKIQPSLMKLAHDLGITNAIHFLGRIDDKDLLNCYSVADVFVLPSFFESFGIPLIEAMASGTPVISTRAGAIPEIIEHGKSGLLIEKGNVVELADAITHVLLNPHLAKEMAAKGREVIRERYLLDSITKRLEKTYLSLVAERDG